MNKSLRNEISGKNYALILAIFASFIPPFVGSSINVALPTIASEFGISAIILSWIPTAYLLALAIFLVPFSRIADIYGRKKVFIYGMILFTISSFLAALSNSGFMLIFFRIFQGIGSAMIYGNLFAIIISFFPATERGKALGLTITGVFMGLFLGPVLGGFLTQYLGWRSIFIINVPIGIITTFAATKLKGEWAEAIGEKFDTIGSIILGLSLILMMYGLSELPEKIGVFLILAGLVGIFIFYKVEKRTDSPVLNVNLFKNRAFTSNNLVALINYSAGVSVVFVLSLYLQYIKGLSPEDAGIILAVQPVMMAIFSPFAGRLSDKIEARIVASVGMAVSSAGLAIFIFLDKNTSLDLAVAGLIILGIGFALFTSPNTNAVMSSVKKKYYGAASATLSTMRVMGQMSGMGIAILSLALFLGNAKIVPENFGLFLASAKTSFLIFSFLSLIGVFASLVKVKDVHEVDKTLERNKK
ncbi:MAG: MFS transporter [Euryarchaeota archaeon]|nr:MFS transporter [Euryarchaeota archaeon]